MDFEEKIGKLSRQLQEIQKEILRYRAEEQTILDRIRVYYDRDDDVLLVPLDVHMQLLIPNLRRMRELKEVLERLNREICENEECRESFFGMWIMSLAEQNEKTLNAVKETTGRIQKIVPVLSDVEQYTVGELRNWHMDEPVQALIQALNGLSGQLETMKELFEGVVMGYNSTGQEKNEEQ